jgi:hypothetical protein
VYFLCYKYSIIDYRLYQFTQGGAAHISGFHSGY